LVDQTSEVCILNALILQGYCGGIEACQKAGCTIGWAWQGGGSGVQRHVSVESFLIVYQCVLKLSLIDTQKDSSCAHKGLMTN
jgi:hypothetical protein